MNSKGVLVIGALSMVLAGISSLNPAPLPDGWLINGGANSWLYTATVDQDHRLSEQGAKRLKSNFLALHEDAFCAISQRINPIQYRGKRVRFSAMVSVDAAESGAALYIRADTPLTMADSLAQTAADALRGSQDWRRHELIIDVPQDAMLLSVGMLLTGQGTAWIDNLKLELVDDSVPLTNARSARSAYVLDGLPITLSP